MTSNSAKGEVGFSVDGGEYVLHYDFNALVTLEEEFDCSVSKLEQILSEDARLADLRTVFRIGLQRHQPDLDDEAVGDVMSALGIQPAVALIGKAFNAAFPEAKAEAGKANARPKTRRTAAN